MEKRVVFKGWKLPVLLVTPQLIISAVFFFYPSGQAIWNSLFLPDPFGLKTQFVGLDNFRFLLTDPYYLGSFKTTITFSILVTVSSMLIGLYLAALADRLIKGSGVYQTLLIWPYAIAPAVVGVMANYFFSERFGLLYHLFHELWGFNWYESVFDSYIYVIIAGSWKQISANFIFFLAGLQAIQKSVIEASMIDCKNSFRRFWTITFPLLMPTTFFLIIILIQFLLYLMEE